jgi:hypothetical protein
MENNTAIGRSFERFTGATPIISSSPTSGPGIKSKRESAVERAKADLEANEATFAQRMDLNKREALAGRDLEETLNPEAKYSRIMKERAVEGTWNRLENENAAFNRSINANMQRAGQRASGMDEYSTRQQAFKNYNWQQAQAGTPYGQTMLSKEIQRYDPNTSEYRGLSQKMQQNMRSARPSVF